MCTFISLFAQVNLTVHAKRWQTKGRNVTGKSRERMEGDGL